MVSSSRLATDLDLVLDPGIRNWGVLPIVVFVLCINLLRSYLTHLAKTDKQPNKEEFRHKQTLMRADRLRANGQWVRPAAFASRRAYFTTKDTGALYEEVPGAVSPMSNPMGMMEMVKGQAYFAVTQMGMMQFSEMFFSGFVLIKVPFSLTNSFKAMLQRGVELSTLDASYVSATSWMFLVSFGVKDLQRFLMDDDNMVAEEAKAMQMQMGMTGAAPIGFDCSKAYAAARDGLDMIRHTWALDDVEKRLLGDRYPAAKSATEAFLTTTTTQGKSDAAPGLRKRPTTSSQAAASASSSGGSSSGGATPTKRSILTT